LLITNSGSQDGVVNLGDAVKLNRQVQFQGLLQVPCRPGSAQLVVEIETPTVFSHFDPALIAEFEETIEKKRERKKANKKKRIRV